MDPPNPHEKNEGRFTPQNIGEITPKNEDFGEPHGTYVQLIILVLHSQKINLSHVGGLPSPKETHLNQPLQVAGVNLLLVGGNLDIFTVHPDPWER